jgi:hypothetical protein
VNEVTLSCGVPPPPDVVVVPDVLGFELLPQAASPTASAAPAATMPNLFDENRTLPPQSWIELGAERHFVHLVEYAPEPERSPLGQVGPKDPPSDGERPSTETGDPVACAAPGDRSHTVLP